MEQLISEIIQVNSKISEVEKTDQDKITKTIRLFVKNKHFLEHK